MLKFVVHPATRGYVDSHGLCSCWRPCWYRSSALSLKAMRMSVIFADTRNYVDVWWPVYHQRPLLPSEAMLLPMICAASKGHDAICSGLCWCRKPCGFLRPELLSEAMWKPMIHDASDCTGQRKFICNGISRCKLTVESWRHRRLLCCGIFVHYVRKYNCDWCNKKNWITNTWEGHIGRTSRQRTLVKRKTESPAKYREGTGGARWKRGNDA